MRKKALKWIDWTRQQELEALAEFLAPAAKKTARLLEIGGGNGFLARRLAKMGFDVVSIDPQPRQPSYFPVQIGDCTRLEFETGSFDVIFSSNVLEHVEDIPAALAQMKRLLKPGGFMVHSMPLPFCTLLTLLTRPIGYFMEVGFVIRQGAKFTGGKIFPKKTLAASEPSAKGPAAPAKSLNKQNLLATLGMLNPLRVFIPPPHGSSGSCLAELRDWKPSSWCEKFNQQHLHVKAVAPLPLAYSRHVICPFRLIGLRRRLAQTGHCSCCAYVVQT